MIKHYVIISTILGDLKSRGIFIDAEPLDIELPDPKDREFFEIVMEERKNENAYLITGNLKHFPAEPFIVTPRQMLDIILDEE